MQKWAHRVSLDNAIEITDYLNEMFMVRTCAPGEREKLHTKTRTLHEKCSKTRIRKTSLRFLTKIMCTKNCTKKRHENIVHEKASENSSRKYFARKTDRKSVRKSARKYFRIKVYSFTCSFYIYAYENIFRGDCRTNFRSNFRAQYFRNKFSIRFSRTKFS